MATADFRARQPRPAGPRQELLRSEEHTSELQSRLHLVCRLLLEKKKKTTQHSSTSLILHYHFHLYYQHLTTFITPPTINLLIRYPFPPYITFTTRHDV